MREVFFASAVYIEVKGEVTIFPCMCVRDGEKVQVVKRTSQQREDKSGDQLTWLLTALTNLWSQTVQERQVELEEVYTYSGEQARPFPWGDSSRFELYQGLRLINKLLEKELITKTE